MLAEEQARTLVDNVEAKALLHKLANTLEVVEADFIGYTLVCVEPKAWGNILADRLAEKKGKLGDK